MSELEGAWIGRRMWGSQHSSHISASAGNVCRLSSIYKGPSSNLLQSPSAGKPRHTDWNGEKTKLQQVQHVSPMTFTANITNSSKYTVYTNSMTHTHAALSSSDSADQQEQMDFASHNPPLQRKKKWHHQHTIQRIEKRLNSMECEQHTRTLLFT